MKKKDLKIVFFGTRELGAIVLEHLLARGYSPSLVITSPDKPAERKQELAPSPVKSFVMKHKTWNIELLQPEKLDSSFRFHVSNFMPDLLIVAAYGKLIPKEVLDIPKYGALNVHPSLLPKYRGPSPERSTLLNGEKKAGTTVIVMDEEVDHGPIVAQREFFIPKGMKHEELHCALAELGGELLVETIPQWLAGTIVPKEQDHAQATYTKRLKKEDGHIDWDKPAEQIERQIRAFTPWPGSFTFWGGKRIEIIRGYPLLLTYGQALANGQTFLYKNNRLGVQSGEGIFVIETLKPEGKDAMLIKAFLNGHQKIIGAILT